MFTYNMCWKNGFEGNTTANTLKCLTQSGSWQYLLLSSVIVVPVIFGF